MKQFIIIVCLSILLLVSSVWWASNKKEEAQKQEITGLVTTVITERSHTEEEVGYEDTPPNGGNHHPLWLSCNGDVYDSPVVDENAVHSLEHGAVWITYQPELAAEQVDTLKRAVGGYSFMSPYPGQKSPIMLTAWGVQISLDSADDPRINQFLTRFSQGAQTPEPGATCNTIPGRM